ncbi:MAG TPA: GNAT family N-acetyltransferase [Longimicrobiales bacterium]|nr:GNAT family N-acetyltransferase [Longimicrobiales bacterium]
MSSNADQPNPPGEPGRITPDSAPAVSGEVAVPSVPPAQITIRNAKAGDLPDIVALLTDDMLGRTRESADGQLAQSYVRAFAAIDEDPNNELLVAFMDGRLVATLQLTFTPSLSFQGSWRATIESVRAASDLRGRGIGAVLMSYAIDRARERDCGIVQLSTNKIRTDARRFYERLGFTASHHGMKLMLERGNG